jgi:hypothetical protein
MSKKVYSSTDIAIVFLWHFTSDDLEKIRLSANSLHAKIVQEKIEDITVVDCCKSSTECLAFVEGLALSNYQF